MTANRTRDWGRAALREVATIERRALSPSEIEGGTLYVGLEHMDSSGGFLGVARVQSGDLASTKFRFTPSHILYGKLRPYLAKIARPAFSGVCSTDILPIAPGPSISKDFLYYYLRQPQMIELATAQCSGANLPRLSPRHLAEFSIPLPPLPEQNRIAAILDQADAIRRKRRQAGQIAAELPTAIFLDMFGDPAGNPKAWPVVPMGQLFASSPNYGTMQQPSNHPGGWLDLRVANIQGGVLDLSDRKYVELEPSMIPRHEVRDGDLLLARAIGSREHLGKCFIAHPGKDRWAFDSHLMRIRLDRAQATPEFIQAFLASPGGRYEFLKHTRRSAVQFNVNTKEMAQVEVPLPPIALQQRFVSALAEVSAMQLHLFSGLAQADDLFTSTVSRVFQGKL